MVVLATGRFLNFRTKRRPVFPHATRTYGIFGLGLTFLLREPDHVLALGVVAEKPGRADRPGPKVSRKAVRIGRECVAHTV